DHGKGGRNQQTVLAAAEHVLSMGDWPPGLLIASIGTDGEDGPTDAAGGLVDANVVEAFLNENVASESDAGSREGGAPVPQARLTEQLISARLRCDAYPLLDRSRGLVRTGPSGTNVADLRILLARP
ncbi:MAG: MOFRL family protein, partial [Planctomycetaceae bacterium]